MIKVKQLQWEEYAASECGYSQYIANDLRYKIEWDDGVCCCYLGEPTDQIWDNMCDTWSEAKASCQKHYNNLILSGIEVSNED